MKNSQKLKTVLTATLISAFLASCGGGDQRADLISNQPLYGITLADYTNGLTAAATAGGASSAAGITRSLAGSEIKCGFSGNKITYKTVNAKNQLVNTEAVVLVPQGNGADCSGDRPVVLLAHGTTTDVDYDISSQTNGEGQLAQAFFASRGFVVVAPNYVGYGISKSQPHPYLVEQQQSKDMIDAYKAAKKSNLFKEKAGKLFVTGYSQGGFVAMATHKAMQQEGITVAASAPLSGPYAIQAISDKFFVDGDVNLGATTFYPFIMRAYQEAYGNVYKNPSEVYTADWISKGIATLLPGTNSTITSSGLDAASVFSTTSFSAGGYGIGSSNFIVPDSLVTAYKNDVTTNPDRGNAGPAITSSHPVRNALKNNDLRNWKPNANTQVLLCAGSGDSVVYIENTNLIYDYWIAGGVPSSTITKLDLSATPSGAFAPIQTAFQGTGLPGNRALNKTGAGTAYHSAAAPFCYKAASDFFNILK
ncbi:MAG: alpha/beta fold hydrolase [Gammaproteobacteria bacterium]|nr:alpha/beta fold hydrolase [Gammaproteobacteria bacterium]